MGGTNREGSVKFSITNNQFIMNSSIFKFSDWKTKWKTENGKWQIQRAFTLIELLVVISIISVLVTVGLVSFRNSQLRGRDVQRKSDLKQLANSLELFYTDYNKYPDSTGGFITACPYNPATGTGTSCSWGGSEFTDGRNIYFKEMPQDPSNGYSYYYRVVDTGENQKYQLFARIENTEDPDCLGGSCSAPPVTHSCGSKTCNFSITSTNTKATE